MVENSAEIALSNVFRALSDGTRRALLVELCRCLDCADKRLCVCLYVRYGMIVPAVRWEEQKHKFWSKLPIQHSKHPLFCHRRHIRGPTIVSVWILSCRSPFTDSLQYL